MPYTRKPYLCNACEEGATSSLYGICDECAIGIAQQARLERAEAAKKQAQ